LTENPVLHLKGTQNIKGQLADKSS